jgi:hypothetical protein
MPPPWPRAVRRSLAWRMTKGQLDDPEYLFGSGGAGVTAVAGRPSAGALAGRTYSRSRRGVRLGIGGRDDRVLDVPRTPRRVSTLRFIALDPRLRPY